MSPHHYQLLIPVISLQPDISMNATEPRLRATIDPTDPVLAGELGTWRLTVEAVSEGLPAGTVLRVTTDSDTDWGVPQFDDPGAAEYMTFEVPDGVSVLARTDGLRGVRATLAGAGLEPGERIVLVYGDTAGGGPGSRAQTFREPRRYFHLQVDRGGDGEWDDVADRPELAVVGGDPVRLVVIAPSEVTPGEPFAVLVKAEDRWGNASNIYRGTVVLDSEGIAVDEPEVTFTDADRGVCRVEPATALMPGVHTLMAVDESAGLRGESNPVCVAEHIGEHRLAWADPHGGQVVDRDKIADFFAHARDVAGIQFAGYQRNADVASSEDYAVQQDVERAFHQPGRFIAIPGYEWSGRTWQGGHHNIYFRRHGRPIRRNAPAETPESVDQATELVHIREVYEHYRGQDVIITPHVGGEHSDLDDHDPTLEPAVEIVSSHGAFEWMRRDALARGYRLGFLGGSDSYTGRPGDDRPGHQVRRYSKAGLTGIYCCGVTLEDFFEAMRARRVFATTGERIVVRVDADGHLMGSEYSTGELPEISVAVVGTAPLESVELLRGEECLGTWDEAPAETPGRIRLLWQGSSRQTSYSGVVWDGRLSVTGGRITAAETLRFDSPRSHIVDRDEHSLSWHAWGCGYRMGIVLDIDGDDQTRIDVSVATQVLTGPAYGDFGSTPPRRISLAPAERGTVSARLRDLGESPRTLDLGVLDRSLTLGLAPGNGPRETTFSVRDEHPLPGINPYWVRVVQVDQEMAWTSPVFVDWVEPPG